jgi:hypothetical protein
MLGRCRHLERIAAPAMPAERSAPWRGVDAGLGAVAVECCFPSLASDRARAADEGRAAWVGRPNRVAVGAAGALRRRRFGCFVTVETGRAQ